MEAIEIINEVVEKVRTNKDIYASIFLGPDGTSISVYPMDEDVDAVEKHYKVITLCGSTKFKDEFMQVQKELTLQGNIVISVGCFGHAGDVFTDEQKIMLDDMHKRKIDMADEIVVINKGGYIGSSTKSEIAYAEATGKTITYLEPLDGTDGRRDINFYMRRFTRGE